ncbi:MAG TPA: ATP-binding cassette domain-containing protein [Candidatus Acidoferrum sp.]|nr:ATP-binding cassette domain-containing protein [Candidatus Acidoferrum sp.]
MRGVSRYFEINNRLARALNEVSFEVRRGEVFGLLGPNGSGKSTTLRILAGRLSPSEGKARVFGRPPQRRSARKRVGYLPERKSHNQPYFFAHGMGFLRDLLIWRRRRRFSDPFDMMPGNQRFSALKQLLIRNPELLLLDEPFSGLDAAGCAEITDLIVAFAQRGKTVILASDSLTYAKDICDRFAVYYGGKIETLGALDEILATTDAIRVTGPVLPQETAQRLLKALREDLGRSPSAELSFPQPQSDSPIAAPAAVFEQAAVATTPDEVLTPLVGGRAKGAPTEVEEQIASPINHERLAALAKPAPTAAPPEP